MLQKDISASCKIACFSPVLSGMKPPNRCSMRNLHLMPSRDSINYRVWCLYRSIFHPFGLILMVAVGMRVTRHPPHRSQSAELPHWAPTSGGVKTGGLRISNSGTMVCADFDMLFIILKSGTIALKAI